jgi:hypothetical protein
VDHNPHLGRASGNKGGPDDSENPAQVTNICWQTRPAPLTPYESALARALTEIFAADLWELDQVAEALNGKGLAPPAGTTWTAPVLAAELARLGA